MQKQVDSEVDQLQDARAMAAVAKALFANRAQPILSCRIVARLDDDEGEKRDVPVFFSGLPDSVARALGDALEGRASEIVKLVDTNRRSR